MTVTLSLADFDLSTRSASGFLLKYIAPRLEPVMLYGPFAKHLLFSLAASKSDLIIAVGHGAADEVTGQGDATLLKVGQYNQKEVKDKVIYAFSCLTAEQLGPDLISRGAKAFLGWLDDYLWIIDKGQAATPWNDELAAPCIFPVIDGLNSLLDGDTAGEAYQNQIDSYTRYAGNMDDGLIKDLVLFNQSNFVLYGDPSAKITPRPALGMIFQKISPPPMILPV